MKVITKSWGDKVFVTGNKKFSVFYIRSADLLADPKLQEEELFSLSSRFGKWGDTMFNSGERCVSVVPVSLEEKHDLFKLFQENGFKVRWWDWDDGRTPFTSRKYFTEKDYEEDDRMGPEMVEGDEFRLILTRKQFPKFQKFLRTLSKVYNYKTEYLMGKPNSSHTRFNYRFFNSNYVIK